MAVTFSPALTAATVYERCASGGCPRVVDIGSPPAGAKGLALFVTTFSPADAPLATAATYGGLTMTDQGNAGNTASDTWVRVWTLIGFDGASGTDLAFYPSQWADSNYAVAYWVLSDADLSVYDASVVSSTANGEYTTTLDATGAAGDLTALVYAAAHYNGTPGLYGDQEAIASVQLTSSPTYYGYRLSSLDFSEPYGEETVGASTGGVVTLGALLFLDVAVTVIPSGFGAEAGFQAGVEIQVPEEVTLYLARLAAEAGFRDGSRLRNVGKRQVMLTGSGVETPEMTVGGTEGQVLTQHAKSPPTWEDGGGTVEALDDIGDVDAPLPIDGDVLTWDDYAAEWVAAAPAGGGALDDLTDVDAPSPADNDVLAWDDGAGAWVPVAPGTPDLSAAVLDDIGDVAVAAPSDGDVLTWDDGAGEWVAAAPSAPAADTPPALRVYLYNTFR